MMANSASIIGRALVIGRVALAIAAMTLLAPARTLEAQRIPIDSSASPLGPITVRQPTIVLFHYDEGATIEAAVRRQVQRLRPVFDSLGVTIIERHTARVPYVAAGSMIIWAAARDSLPQGYLFLQRSGLSFIRYGLVPDSTLAAAVQIWSPPPVRLVVP